MLRGGRGGRLPTHRGTTQALWAGAFHTCSHAGGTATCWGRDDEGQLGRPEAGGPGRAGGPVTVAAVQGVRQLALGRAHTCALDAEGRVTCWGRGAEGQLGRPAGSSNDARPDLVSGLPVAIELVAGARHTCARHRDGRVSCWGANDHGQLGSAAGTGGAPGATPVEVAGLEGAIGLAAGGDTTCALLASRQVACWGDGAGVLERGPAPVARPVTRVPGLERVSGLAVGRQAACAVLPSGQILCWGRNDRGQVGRGGTSPEEREPAPVGLSDVVEVRMYAARACARTRRGLVHCWGETEPTTGAAHAGAPSLVPGLADASALAVGQDHACALRGAGGVICWGRDDHAQLGRTPGSSASGLSPVEALQQPGQIR
jgi:alpha-tubulin suppressor-like RCC1 family protein